MQKRLFSNNIFALLFALFLLMPFLPLTLTCMLLVHTLTLRLGITTAFSHRILSSSSTLRSSTFSCRSFVCCHMNTSTRRSSRRQGRQPQSTSENSNSRKKSTIKKVKSTPANAQEQEASKEADERPHLYLLKSEPHEFSIEQLKAQGREEWDGVRNYTARNFMRQMKVGDRCWFYHSSCKTPAIVGVCRIVREAQPDQTALDPRHEYYDPKSTAEKCRWDSVLVEFDTLYETPVTLKELRAQATVNSVIAGMMLLHRSRLSVMPVTTEEWSAVKELMKRKEIDKEDLTAVPSSSQEK